ncbi:MAG TPA: class I SAM-dependent methyltransferase [Usitatibacter sp.]|nr:class I SAM-dependent methyltransferase [Usitatibacter sp.]
MALTHRIIAALALPLALAVRAASEDVPFITTPDNVTVTMLQIARVNAQDYVIDLGSGDGRIVITAAKQFGARGLGVEIVPDLVKRSRENAAAAGVASRVEFREDDLFKADLAKATVITMYLLPEVNLELRPKLLALKPGTRIVSHDWDMGDWPPERSVTLDVPDKVIGREKSSKVHLWIVPARVNGAWCAAGKSKSTLEIDQKFQSMRATALRGEARHSFDGRIRGSQLQSIDGDLVMNLEGERLKPVVARNAFSSFRGVTFSRRTTDSCR